MLISVFIPLLHGARSPVCGNKDFLEEKAGQPETIDSVGRTGFRE
jgi:hypothetical protein